MSPGRVKDARATLAVEALSVGGGGMEHTDLERPEDRSRRAFVESVEEERRFFRVCEGYWNYSRCLGGCGEDAS